MTVFISRSKPRARDFYAEVRNAGLTPTGADLVYPVALIDRESLTATLGTIDAPVFVFTSPQAVRIFHDTAGHQQGAGHRPDEARIICAGESSAEAGRDIGIGDFEVCPPGQTGAIDYLSRNPPSPHETVVLPRSQAADDRLTEYLESQGIRVVDIALYKPVTNTSPDVGTAIRSLAAEPAVVVFTSPSSVRAFLSIAGARGSGYFANKYSVAIGDTTAGTLREATGGCDGIADEPTMHALAVAAIAGARKLESKA